jgi:hypothetical protein
MSCKFHYTWENTTLHKLTHYQRMILFHIVGMLTNEDSGMLASATVKVDIKADKVKEHVTFKFYGVSISLMSEYLRNCVFKEDTNLINTPPRFGGSELGDYAGVLVWNKEIGTRPVTVQELYYYKPK